ncbi:MAG: hypothetical protein A3D31_09330 [Candidatus Fluviicola riflensis]|nr:MAG: hypothetical protein CHH17_13740 [Candidatus Fluviicola riflensis]OGS77209.1 MAG: hypothetical protein A3D31_09330 [Candidatus Fluviicola riflensis]OGS82144.1 MAG: hypothetical protein A2724_18275 [Fluviicola sp. RIFCSPHIGHO2_01_FULL_43_53]OGS87838.1 MAG: hypothetical protein A3E30_15710 [Fluviicola sp. RIFCSPHIGHO2_12_FULL_43_24]
MLGSLLKKKLSDNQLANVFMNGILEMVENGFGEVAQLINEDPAFITSPNIQEEKNGQFSMVVMVANLSYLESTFEVEQAVRVEQLIFDKLGKMMQASAAEAEETVRDYQKFMLRINHPSKNMVYAMSKAVFYKYDLNDYQDEYFRRMQAPNPLFLKRMDAVVGNFLWDWDAFFKKYRIED